MVSQDPLESRSGIVTLLTDFGESDAYAGVMKGVILARAPGAQIVDLTHQVVPQAVAQAAFLLETAWRFFPPGTVHVVVVDPGVGTVRRRLAVSAGGHFFVGPDNGVLSAALPEVARGYRSSAEGYRVRQLSLPAGVSGVAVENETLFLQPMSATFEGRDVFAPAAAHLASGGVSSDLGPEMDEMAAFAAFRAPVVAGRINGLVLRADRFGNLITDIVAEDLATKPVFTVAGLRLELARTYADAAGPLAIIGSSGRIEIVVSNGSAALVLGAGPGDRVVATASRS